VVDAVCGDLQSQRPHGSDGGLTSAAIRHYTRHRLNVGPPPAVFLAADEDGNRFYGNGFYSTFVLIIISPTRSKGAVPPCVRMRVMAAGEAVSRLELISCQLLI
jgi:hypothetical protein